MALHKLSLYKPVPSSSQGINSSLKTTENAFLGFYEDVLSLSLSECKHSLRLHCYVGDIYCGIELIMLEGLVFFSSWISYTDISQIKSVSVRGELGIVIIISSELLMLSLNI